MRALPLTFLAVVWSVAPWHKRLQGAFSRRGPDQCVPTSARNPPLKRKVGLAGFIGETGSKSFPGMARKL